MSKIVWIISGIPGVGKSTTSKALAKSLDLAAYIEGDMVREMIVSGYVFPTADPFEESMRQIRLGATNCGLLARSFIKAGFTPVIDFAFVTKEHYDHLLQELDGFDARLITLAPGKQVAFERDRLRSEKTLGDQFAYLDDVMRKELGTTGLWIDNSVLTIEETVNKILMTA
jgi:gluconate kinase